MSIKNRIEKLEQVHETSGFVVIALDEGETNEEAYQRCFPDARQTPKAVIYATPLDILL